MIGFILKHGVHIIHMKQKRMQSQLYAYLINGILEMNAVSNQSLCNTINNQNKLQQCILHYFRAISW